MFFIGGEQEEETEDEEEIEEENATLSPQPSQPNTSAGKFRDPFV